MYLGDFYGWNWRIPGFDENKIQHWALFSTKTNQGPFYFHWAYNLEFARTKRFAKTVGIHPVFCSFLKKFRKKIAFYLISNFSQRFAFFFCEIFALFFREILAFLIKRKFRIFSRNRLKRNFVKKRKFSPFLRAKEIQKRRKFSWNDFSYSLQTLSLQGTVVNPLPSLHRGSFEITLTVPLRAKLLGFYNSVH